MQVQIFCQIWHYQCIRNFDLVHIELGICHIFSHCKFFVLFALRTCTPAVVVLALEYSTEHGSTLLCLCKELHLCQWQ